jgi:hypothetical protein
MKRVAGSTAARLFFVSPPGPPHRLRRCRAARQCHRSNSRTHRHGLPGLGGLPDRKHQNPQSALLGHAPVRSMTSQRLALMPAEPHLLAQDPALTNARTEERSARSARCLATARSNPHTRSAFASRSLYFLTKLFEAERLLDIADTFLVELGDVPGMPGHQYARHFSATPRIAPSRCRGRPKSAR